MKPENLGQREVSFDINRDLTRSEFIQGKKERHRGFKESDDVCAWFSKVFQKEILVIRADPNAYDETISEKRFLLKKEEDVFRRIGFSPEAPIHAISEQSVQALNEMLKSKYDP